MQTTGKRGDWDDSGSWIVVSAIGHASDCAPLLLYFPAVRTWAGSGSLDSGPYGGDAGMLGVAVRPGSDVTVQETDES